MAAKTSGMPFSSSRRTEDRIRRFLLSLVALALAGCVQPAAADTCNGEVARARAVARTIKEEWPLRSTDEVTQLVTDVMQRLTRTQPARHWEIVVVRNRKAEAYSIGDGRIYISDGAVRSCATESELAAVLAHEIAHQMLGHFCRPASSRSGRWARPRSVGSVKLRIDPDRELAADRYGLDLIARVGYDPQAALRIAERVQQADSMGHLDEMGRVERLQGLLPRYDHTRGYQSDAFARVHAILIGERPLDR